MSTILDIRGEKFFMNDHLTYDEIPGSDLRVRGLLMNARFIQGIFDDKTGRARYARFGAKDFDPEEHTDALARALPQWHRYGLRAFTVGLQGGMPVFTIENATIDNNPYGEDGTSIDVSYLRRLDRLIGAADDAGMAVIVSLLYQGQAPRMKDELAIRNAVTAGSRFLRDTGRSNVIIEIANEQDIGEFSRHPVVSSPDRVTELMELARRESAGMPVGCSSSGGVVHEEIVRASDVILVHGNGCTRQGLHRLIARARSFGLDRPIVCNEDSPCIGQLAVAFGSSCSWGYYNNLTKQEPPVDWSVTRGEDLFFARRMARGLGIHLDELARDDQYVFQGFEPRMSCDGKRWLRIASEFPESIDFVEFFHEGRLVDTTYDEPFFLHHLTSWIAGPVDAAREARGNWMARIHLRAGDVIERQGEIA